MVEPDRRRPYDPEATFSAPVEAPRRFSSSSNGTGAFDNERARTPDEAPPSAAPRSNPAVSPPATAPSPSGATVSSSHVRTSEVERAVFSYAPIASPAAAEVDAIEAGRRARQESSKAAPAPVLKLAPLAPERPKVDFKQG